MKKSSSNFVVQLDNVKHAPKLAVNVKPLPDKPHYFLISILHPNTRQPLYSQEHKAKDISAAIKLGNEIREKPEFSHASTWHEEILHIPQPKRGKMKLNTKESAVEEAKAKQKVKTDKAQEVKQEKKEAQAKNKVQKAKVKAQKVAKAQKAKAKVVKKTKKTGKTNKKKKASKA